jgi:hypothetical protein
VIALAVIVSALVAAGFLTLGAILINVARREVSVAERLTERMDAQWAMARGRPVRSADPDPPTAGIYVSAHGFGHSDWT